MTNKELIINLLDKEMSEEIFVYTKEGKKKSSASVRLNQRLMNRDIFTEILLEN